LIGAVRDLHVRIITISGRQLRDFDLRPLLPATKQDPSGTVVTPTSPRSVEWSERISAARRAASQHRGEAADGRSS
jgi:hypothetical protein